LRSGRRRPAVLDCIGLLARRPGRTISFSLTQVVFGGDMGRKHQWTKVRRTKDGGIVKVSKFGRKRGRRSPGCFPEGSRVLTPSGWIAIEKLTGGDMVFSYCPTTLQLIARMVVSRIDSPPRRAVEESYQGAGQAYRRDQGARVLYDARLGANIKFGNGRHPDPCRQPARPRCCGHAH
jgi:hypothetical protein